MRYLYTGDIIKNYLNVARFLGPGGTSYNGLHWKAPAEMDIPFSGFRYIKKLGFHKLKYMKM